MVQEKPLENLRKSCIDIKKIQIKVKGSLGSSGNSSWSGKYIQPVERVLLTNFGVTWKMYVGLDWYDHKIQGETTRNACSLFEVELQGMSAQYDVFLEVGWLYASKFAVSIQDLGILDHSECAP